MKIIYKPSEKSRHCERALENAINRKTITPKIWIIYSVKETTNKEGTKTIMIRHNENENKSNRTSGNECQAH